MKADELINDFRSKSIQLDMLDEYCDLVIELQSQLKEKDKLIERLMRENGNRQLRIEQLEDQIKNLKN
jgi:hypothetical protein